MDKIVYCCTQKYFTLTVYADKRIVIKKEDMRDTANPCVGELTLMWEELPCVTDLLKIAWDEYKAFLSKPPK